MATGTRECLTCGTLWAAAMHDACPVCHDGDSEVYPPPVSVQDRLAVDWEKMRPLIPDGELKSFICRALMTAMETWRGGNPPRPKVLTVALVTRCSFHDFRRDESGDSICLRCGQNEQHEDVLHEHPLSPYAGFGGSW